MDPYMVCARLRWTRNGMKTLMHILNGADPWQKHRIDQAVRNCTANELRRLASGVTKLWEDPLLPWCPKAAMQSATKVYPHLLAVVQQEVARRAAGGKYEPDQLSRAMLVRLNYIQLYRTPRARQVLNIHMNTGITQVLPKGSIESNEKPWAGALRELKEETGIPTSDVLRDTSFATLQTRGLTMFVVRAARWESSPEWETPHSAETVGAMWVKLSAVRLMFLPRAMKAIVDQLGKIILRQHNARS